MAAAALPDEKTFQYEGNLPSLPLPPLEQTLDKYLASVRPFVDPEEFKETERIVSRFKDGHGKDLHGRLEQRAKNSRNWLEFWWEDLGYLYQRTPLAILGSMVGSVPSCETIWGPQEGLQLVRTSKSIWACAKYFQMIRRETLPVMRSLKGEVFSMFQYQSFFSTCRVPGETKDTVARYFKTESEGSCPLHVVILCNGHIFKMEVFDQHEEPYGSYEILRQLTHIKERSLDKGQGIGVLTADDRTSWAQAYDHLVSLDPSNKQLIEIIQSAIMVASLDSEAPQNITQLMTANLAGKNCEDRWFDKSFDVVYYRNGLIGFIGDHCPYEGIVGTMFNAWGDDYISRITTDWCGKPDVRTDGSVPQELTFVTDDRIREAQAHARDTYMKLAAKCDIFCSGFSLYGRAWVKEQGFHPDAWMQLAIQLSYYTRHSKPAPCYETATTRGYYHGRTETIRSCSSEMVEWCKAMQDPAVNRGERLDLMKAAATAHIIQGSEAMDAQGCDRHLLGLYAESMDAGEDIPEIFTDPAFIKCGGGGNFVLSTSLLGYWSGCGGVVPMRDDGYGIFYNLRKYDFYLSIFSFKTCPETSSYGLFEEMYRSLVRMQNVATEAKL